MRRIDHPLTNIRRAFRQRKFLVRLMTSIVLLAVVPNLLLGSISYINVMSTFEAETGASNTRYLKQSMNALELVIQQITGSCQQLVLNPTFRSFESFPNGSYYERLSGAYPEQDLPALYDYIKKKTAAIESIQYFKMSNEFVDSVYYYDSGKNLVLAVKDESTIEQYAYPDFFDKGWYATWQSKRESPILLDPRMAMQMNGQTKEMVTLLLRTYQNDNVFIVNLDADAIYNKIINELNGRGNLYVLSAAGGVLFRQELAPDQLGIADKLAQVPASESTGYVRTAMNGDQALVTYAKSKRLGWTFVNVNSMDNLLASTKYLRRVIVYSILLLLVLSVSFSLLASKRLYRPIGRIVTMLASSRGKPADSSWKDEVHRIGEVLRSAFDERDLYMRKLEMSLPYYREQLKSELLQVPAAPGDALQEKLAELSIPIGMHHLALLLVTFEERTGAAALNGTGIGGRGGNSASGANGGRMEVPWTKIRLLDELEQGTLLRGPYMTVDTGQRQLAIVVHADATAMSEVFQLGEQMIERMEQLAEETVSIGVGRYCASIAELPRAYEEASEALRFRLLHGRGQVIYIEDVVLEREDASGAVFPKEQEELFAGYVKLGNAEQAKRIVRELIASCAAQKHRIHYAELQFVLFKIITIVLQTLQHLGADINRLVRVDSNPFRDVMALESMEQLQLWFDGFLQNAADGVGAGKQHKDNHHVARVIEILEQDHGKDLSLNSVSEMLDLNPSYVSRLFKQYTGVSFTEYLTDIRISRSKELLRTTRLQVSEVGSQVGFHNAYYFIKVFKENAGVTPGEFKRIFGVGDADDRLHNDDIANL